MGELFLARVDIVMPPILQTLPSPRLIGAGGSPLRLLSPDWSRLAQPTKMETHRRQSAHPGKRDQRRHYWEPAKGQEPWAPRNSLDAPTLHDRRISVDQIAWAKSQ